MNTKSQYVSHILGAEYLRAAKVHEAESFMPSNIALVKYWGKRAGELNLPLVSSVSYALGDYGTRTKITIADQDVAIFNGVLLENTDKKYRDIFTFLDLFRTPEECFKVETSNNIPTAAGVASSASGYAALLNCIAKIKGWSISMRDKTLLARLGSGSAARSFWPGLVLWHKGEREDGMDSYAEPLDIAPFFNMAVLILQKSEKAVSSRDAMKLSMQTSPLAPTWPVRQQEHLDIVLKALADQDFDMLGRTVEQNAILMHDVVHQSQPSISFDGAETIKWKQEVQALRKSGLPVYFTQDAGPNIKLIFPHKARGDVEVLLKNKGVDALIV